MLCVEVLNGWLCVAEPEAPEEQERAVFTAFCSNTYSTPISFTRAPQYVAALFVVSLLSQLCASECRRNITVKGISFCCPRSTLSSCLSYLLEGCWSFWVWSVILRWYCVVDRTFKNLLLTHFVWSVLWPAFAAICICGIIVLKKKIWSNAVMKTADGLCDCFQRVQYCCRMKPAMEEMWPLTWTWSAGIASSNRCKLLKIR